LIAAAGEFGGNHYLLVFDPLIESPNRFAVLRIPSGFRPVFFAMAFRSIVRDSSINSRSAFIDGPRLLFMSTAQPAIHYPVPTARWPRPIPDR
jgi:hypothetical protein